MIFGLFSEWICLVILFENIYSLIFFYGYSINFGPNKLKKQWVNWPQAMKQGPQTKVMKEKKNSDKRKHFHNGIQQQIQGIQQLAKKDKTAKPINVHDRNTDNWPYAY